MLGKRSERIDYDKPFMEMTLNQISAELAEHYEMALSDVLNWDDSSGSFDVFGKAAAALHEIQEALRGMRYGDDLVPWDEDVKQNKARSAGGNQD